MNIEETFLKGCFIIKPLLIRDSRGYFHESYHKQKFLEQTGKEVDFVQDNESLSKYGVVRGLHMQIGQYAQAKLVRVISGKILDVAVDVRENSPTYGKCFSIEISDENKLQLFIPEGFLHGFSVLSEHATVFYKCNNFYDKASERGVNPLDTNLNIDWKIPVEEMTISDKDKTSVMLKDLVF